MAFPTTPVLDNFNAGASQNLTARTGWGATAFGNGTTSFATDAVPTKATASAGTRGNFWTLSQADAECYATITAFTPSANTFVIAARITATGSSPTHYGWQQANLSSTDLQLVKVVAGVRTAIGTLLSQTFTNGDSYGISVIGNVITGYYKSGAGAWVQKDQVTDSSITAAGHIGIRDQVSSLMSFDNFGGGVPVVAAGRSPITVVRRAWAGA